MMLVFAPEAIKQLAKLPKQIQKKARKQFGFLLADHKHPSLRSRKMEGKGRFEGRIDRKYRFTFVIMENQIWVLTIGLHDVGLGKR